MEDLLLDQEMRSGPPSRHKCRLILAQHLGETLLLRNPEHVSYSVCKAPKLAAELSLYEHRVHNESQSRRQAHEKLREL